MSEHPSPSTDVLLISPPVGNFAQVHPAICLLTRYLRERRMTVIQRDLSIECFHYFHSSRYLSTLKKQIHHQLDHLSRNPPSVDPTVLCHKVRVCLLLDRAARHIDQTKEKLRNPLILDSPAQLASALTILKEVGRAITAAHDDQLFSFQEFKIAGAFDSWKNLSTAITRRDRNLMIEFIEATDLPPARVCGISVTYPDQLLPALCIAQQWRKANPRSQIVFGGSYVTNIEETFRNDPRWFDYFDILVTGDGEEALYRIANESDPLGAVERIPNVLYRSGLEVRRSAATAITRLNDLPTPMLDFRGLDLDLYVTPHLIVPLPATRGCYWGKCTFCNISNQATGPFRARNLPKLFDDIRILSQELNTPYFDFCVDSFHPNQLKGLSIALIEAGLKIHWNAEVLLDPAFDDTVLGLMAASGCRHLRFGFESANPETLRQMNKRNEPVVVERILRACQRYDIKVSLMSIIGFPTESEADVWKTIDFYVSSAALISFVTLHRFNVSAGSPLMHHPEIAGIRLQRRPGLLQPRFDYTNLNENGMTPERVVTVITQMEEVIRKAYPQHEEIYTVGIGGWLTFLACCRHPIGFFKRKPSSQGCLSIPVDPEHLSESAIGGAFDTFPFCVASADEAADHRRNWEFAGPPCCVVLSGDAKRIHVLPAFLEAELQTAFAGKLDQISAQTVELLSIFGVLKAPVEGTVTSHGSRGTFEKAAVRR